jgi:hypothetical protein
MDYARSLSYILEDQEWWQKLLILGLLSLIPIVGPIYVAGYVVQVLKDVIEGREVPLPDAVDEFGARLVNGLLLSIITVIYMLPVIIVACVSGGGSALLVNATGDPDSASIASSIWASCLGCLSFVLGILISLLLPFAWSKFAENGQFGDAFKLGQVFGAVRDNLGPTIIVILISWLVSLAAGLVGLLLCIIGTIFTTVYAQLVTAFLYGALYRQSKEKAL